MAQDDGFAFDDIFIFDKPDTDLGVVSFISPSSVDCSNDSTPVIVEIVNFGTQPQSNVPVTVEITGTGVGPSISTSFAGPINPGDTAEVLVGTINTNAGGQFDFTAYTDPNTEELRFNDSLTLSSMIGVTVSSPTVMGASACFVDSMSFTLTASSTATDNLWYDEIGGNIIAIGDTFKTPPLDTTTTYYVRASNLTQAHVGPADNNIGSGAQFTALAAGLVFDVEQPFILNSVRVFPGGGGTLTINLDDDNGNTVISSNFIIPAGVADTVLELGWDIDVGTNYEINADGSSIPSLYRNSGGATYPYTVPGVLSIINTINDLGGSGYYYFFYDWQITVLGCASPYVPVQAIIQAELKPDLGADGIGCAGLVLDVSDPRYVTYKWNGDPNVNTPVLTIDTTGQYIIEVTDINGCKGADTISMIINPVPMVDIGPDTTGCDFVTLDAGNPGSTYFWSTGETTQTIDAPQSGSYGVIVTSLGCTNSDTAEVEILEGPDLDLGPDRGTCQAYTLDAGNPGAVYMWSTGESSQTISLPTPVAADTVSVTVSLANGCDATDQIIVSAGVEPVVDLSGVSASCDSVMLDASNPGAMYMWSTGETSQTITATASGLYSVVVTDSDGCVGEDSVDIVVNQKPVAGISFDQVNFGFEYTFINTSVGADTVTWDFGDGSPLVSGDTITHTYGAVGAFEVILAVANECGTDTLKEIFTTDVEDEHFGAAFSVYPNPTDGEFYVELIDFRLHAEQLTIEVVDGRGRIVFDETEENVIGSYKQIFDLRKHAEGVYLIKISDGDRTAYKRVVRE